MSEPADAAALDWHDLPIALPQEGASAPFELAGVALLLCHAEGRPWVVRNECPHVRTPLTGGTLRGTVLECPLHGGKLDVSDGSPVAMPVRKPATCYALREAEADDGQPSWQIGMPR